MDNACERGARCALASAPAAHAAERTFTPVTDAMLRDPDPADWLRWRRTLDSSGFSPLAQIDRDNVRQLSVAWSIDLDAAPSQEGIPLVHDGVLYFPAPNDVTLALDASTGTLIWEHRRALPADLGQFVPFPQTNRNLAIYGRLIIDNGADDTIYALDAATGKLAWETEILDYRTYHVKQGSAPLVANGKLIAGRNCQPNGGPDACVITAHDAVTGKELWRKRTIPRPGEPGGDSWGDVPDERRWHVGAWMIPSYDPDLDLVYVGTSVTAPAPKFMLAGNDRQYLYHNSTLALRPATGETVWYYQHAVDHWDLDHPIDVVFMQVFSSGKYIAFVCGLYAPAGHSGGTTSGRPSPRCSRRRAASSSAGTSAAASARSMRRPAPWSGKPISARKSPATRSRSPPAASSTSRSARAGRT